MVNIQECFVFKMKNFWRILLHDIMKFFGSSVYGIQEQLQLKNIFLILNYAPSASVWGYCCRDYSKWIGKLFKWVGTHKIVIRNFFDKNSKLLRCTHSHTIHSIILEGNYSLEFSKIGIENYWLNQICCVKHWSNLWNFFFPNSYLDF